MTPHLRRLKWANFALGAYTFVFGLLFLVIFVFGGWLGWQDGETPGLVFILVGILAFLHIGGLGAAHVVVGYLVGSGRGRAAQTWLASTQLMSFPVGTVYAVYAYWVCWADEDSIRCFESSIKPKVS